MPRLRRKTWRLAIVLSLIVSALPPVPAAGAQVGTQLTGEAFKVRINGPTSVCKDKQVRITVAITHYGVYGNPPVQELRRWGDVAGEVAVTGTPAPLTLAVRPGGSGFQVTWHSVGTYTIRASATRMPSVSPAYTPSADPASMDVEVKDCFYTVQQMSVWYHLPEGWHWWVGGLVPPTTMYLDPNTGEALSSQTFDAFAIASGACSVTTTVTGVTAIIHLTETKPGTLHYRISYTPGNADTKVVCAGKPGENPRGPLSIDAIEKDVDVGDICWPLPFTCLARAWPVVSEHPSHIAHALSDVQGLTFIILEQH